MKPSECEGCDSYRSKEQSCFAILTHTEIKNIMSCPCGKCLVKTMCSDVCDDFLEARRSK